MISDFSAWSPNKRLQPTIASVTHLACARSAPDALAAEANVIQSGVVVLSGRQGNYGWLVVEEQLDDIAEIAVNVHLGLHLCIATFDCGVLQPNESEIRLGWSIQGEVMVSPVLTKKLRIPADEWDEWYILERPDFERRSLERFVNYGSFTIVPPEILDIGRDPTWDRNANWMWEPIQERFWAQIDAIRPESFISIGDNTVVVSRRQEFLDAVRGAV